MENTQEINNKKQMSMDKFRIICAILIVAIHIYPLASINETLDFAFTHILCRIGVPFFLMISGFFILPKAMEDKEILLKYTLKILIIYAISIFLFLPINIYSGKIQQLNVVEMIKEITINGTFYHLWYFPALLLGIWITYLILKGIKNYKVQYCIVIALFIIGLLGDSYYKIAEQVPIIKKCYEVLFQVSNYTRNGLFFVPIFLYLGYRLRKRDLKISKMNNIIFLAIFIVLMLIEGMLLHYFKIQKHDSMYIMLIPTMVVLFNLLKNTKQENRRNLRNIATIIYITHPIFIILVRGVAKVINLENIMIENNLIHYFLVVIVTVVFSIVFEICKEKVRNKYGRTIKEG